MRAAAAGPPSAKESPENITRQTANQQLDLKTQGCTVQEKEREEEKESAEDKRAEEKEKEKKEGEAKSELRPPSSPPPRTLYFSKS